MKKVLGGTGEEEPVDEREKCYKCCPRGNSESPACSVPGPATAHFECPGTVYETPCL
ncbi:hypothetical protein [Pedobacter sp. Hv1]|uniref:hypothetical protein n=1 Tax=Pedobacter sp. Hv1 TaxID=1740090 RepID=UPI0013792277|nr:hypothetical protein [Pedobacter sp. Hv1]